MIRVRARRLHYLLLSVADTRSGKTSINSIVQRDKFAEPQSSFCPPTSSIWSDALRSVDRCHREPLNGLKPGYIFPDVGLMLGAGMDRTKAYIRGWLAYRSGLIHRVVNNSASEPLASQQWSSFLAMPLNASQQSQTTLAQRYEQVKEILNCDLSFRNPSGMILQWRGRDVIEIDETIGREIVWEISELNFRYELVALDRLLSGISSASRRLEVYKCFPPPASLFACDIRFAGRGLAAAVRRDRAPYILALRRLMEMWPEGKPLREVVHCTAEECDDTQLDMIERIVTQIYTQCFFKYFGRAATIPRRLDLRM